MLFRKSSDKENSELQNQFTAYLVTAVRRRRREIVQAQIRRSEREVSMDGPEHFFDADVQNSALGDLAALHADLHGPVCRLLRWVFNQCKRSGGA